MASCSTDEDVCVDTSIIQDDDDDDDDDDDASNNVDTPLEQDVDTNDEDARTTDIVHTFGSIANRQHPEKPQNSHLIQPRHSTNSTDDTLGTLTALALLVLICSIAWHYYKERKERKKWEQSSRQQLEKIRSLSSLGQSNHEIQSSQNANVSIEADVSMVAVSVPNDGAVAIAEEHVQTDNMTIHLDASSDNSTTNELKEQSSDNLSRIREQQQREHEIMTRATQQQRRQERKSKQKKLHTSLQHDVADEAYQRRRHIMLEEERAQVQSTTLTQAPQQQSLYEELQEMERNALLQQQNNEYQESLQRDQERARLIAIKKDTLRRRRKAIHDAKYRLIRSGVQLCDLLDVDEVHHLNTRAAQEQGEEVSDKIDSRKIQVRLLLPSGQRVQETFAEHHVIGLVYDAVLVALDRDDLLWKDEDDSIERQLSQTCPNDSEDEVDTPLTDSLDYDDILTEWKELFNSFSIVSSFPKRTFGDLGVTLMQAGLSQRAMLMVVVGE